MNKSMPVSKARQIASKVADELGYELVDVELVKEPAGKFLRFYVEKGEGVTLDELEVFHRRILPMVEEVDYDYMEVSSPGLDRPLKTDRDFEQAVDLTVELHTYKPINGSKRFTGVLKSYEDGVITLDINGESVSFDKKAVSLVKPVVDFNDQELSEGE